jgi:hypothetical protein
MATSLIVERPEKLIPTKVWFSIHDGGDGSAYPHWFLTEETAEYDQQQMENGWGESCIGSVETYEGSNIHQSATKNDMRNEVKRIIELLMEEKNKYWLHHAIEEHLFNFSPEYGYSNYLSMRKFLKMDKLT